MSKHTSIYYIIKSNMTYTPTFLQMTVIVFFLLFASCKKEEKAPPPVSAASLNAGRAGIRFTTSEDFKGSKSYDVVNTDLTFSLNQDLSGGVRNVRLTTTDRKDNDPYRGASIDIMLNKIAGTTNGNISIDLSAPFFTGNPPAVPRALVRLERISPFGSFFNTVYDSRLGTLTITKLTATEIEGSFNATVALSGSSGSSMVVSNGSFAGNF
ncbi:MAG: hypothetical protein ICV81_06825 [Flavisolibacter sp.]|nr:hypothetical protein [Flavisolibacter sp.]